MIFHGLKKFTLKGSVIHRSELRTTSRGSKKAFFFFFIQKCLVERAEGRGVRNLMQAGRRRRRQ